MIDKVEIVKDAAICLVLWPLTVYAMLERGRSPLLVGPVVLLGIYCWGCIGYLLK